MRKEILALLRQERSSHVSTFFDYYGLPENWPGARQAKGKKAREIAAIVETAMRGSEAHRSGSVTAGVPALQRVDVDPRRTRRLNLGGFVFSRGC